MLIRWAKYLCVFSASLLIGVTAISAKESPKAAPVGKIALKEMPREAQDTLALIRKGGPFKYSKDGTTFGNRERILPKQPRGFYREYTVRTPGSRDRGARRLVCGGETQKECFYTDDHYASFKRVVE